MRNTITLKLQNGIWSATFSGPKSAEIVGLFGTDTLPTAFTNEAPVADVVGVMRSRNPGWDVSVG